jgi:hypothetical protein
MTYVSPNFKTKTALKNAINSGVDILVYNPGLGYPVPQNGIVFIEGPHSPEPHTWSGQGVMKDGKLISIK